MHSPLSQLSKTKNYHSTSKFGPQLYPCPPKTSCSPVRQRTRARTVTVRTAGGDSLLQEPWLPSTTLPSCRGTHAAARFCIRQSVSTRMPKTPEPLCEALVEAIPPWLQNTRATHWDLASGRAYFSAQHLPQGLDSCAQISSPLIVTKSW